MLQFYSIFILLSFAKIAHELLDSSNYIDIDPGSESGNLFKIPQEKFKVNNVSEVDLSEYPYIAAIISSGEIVTCSGTIIKPKWLLTAGHCITKFIKTVAYDYGNPTEVEVAIVKSVRHPQYKMVEENGLVTTLHHDLGLVFYNYTFKLRMTELITFKFRNAENLLDSNVYSFGYGMEKENGEAGILRKIEVTLTECYNDNWRFVICGRVLAPNSSGGVCPGDSGGPVVLTEFDDYSLIGINALGPPLCTSAVPQTDPSTFVDIYKYVPWIDTIPLFYEVELSSMAACSKCPSYDICLTLLIYCAIIKFK